MPEVPTARRLRGGWTINGKGLGRRGWALVTGWALVLTAWLLHPLVASGRLLGHDLVFTARQPLGRDAWGLGSAPPRAVPVDALVALAERVVDGAVVGRLALALPLVAAGVGAAALLDRQALAARLAAVTVAIWNPYVVERLAIGQWTLLWCYAALPWLLLALRATPRAPAWAGRGAGLAAASITPTGGLIALATTVVATVAGRRTRREAVANIGVAAALQLPWLVPALVSPASLTSDPAGVAAFAARAEHPGGALLSVIDGGGIWDADVAPGSRSGPLPWLGLAVLVAAAWYGSPRLRAVLGRRQFAALVGLALGGLLLAALPQLPGGAAVSRALIGHVPGAGLLRDAQKWVLPLVLLEALLVGAAFARLYDRVTTASWRWPLAVAGLALPLIVLPDAAATVRPTLTPVHYPRDWAVVAGLIDGPGDAAVLPWGAYRRFGWARAGSVLDPAPRLLPVSTVVDDRLAVAGKLLRGEDRRAERVRAALAAGPRLPARLAAAGIGWVVVEHGTPGRVPPLSGLRVVRRGPDVSLYRVPGRVRTVHPDVGRVVAVVAADSLAAALLISLLAWPIASRTRRKAQPFDGPALL